MGSQAGTRLLMKQDHRGRSWQMGEHTLRSFTNVVWWDVGMKDIGAGSPGEITYCVGL